MKPKLPTIALIGNPNSGKTSVFNKLTGLHQKTGNFPGVTVDRKTSITNIESIGKVEIVDFPGCYSLYPTAYDEKVVSRVLSNVNDPNFPDLIIYVADVTQLERHLLLFNQLQDLDIPMILCLNMEDLAVERNIHVNLEKFSYLMDTPVLWINGRSGAGILKLKQKIRHVYESDKILKHREVYHPDIVTQSVIKDIRSFINCKTDFQALLIAHHYNQLDYLSKEEKDRLKDILQTHSFKSLSAQLNETMERFSHIQLILNDSVKAAVISSNKRTFLADRIFTHRIWGPIIFFGILLVLFQAIFSWAEWPMNFIDSSVSTVNDYLRLQLPDTWYTSLITDGIIAGLGGIIVFIPQIAILFLMISFLEELGYMARAVYLFDRLMLRFGLNGRSIVALVSGAACAIPAIMSTRTINNWKERLITIMVTPLISCSARLPVFAVLIAFAVPPKIVFGFISAQALVLMGLYLLGIAAALMAAYVFKKVLKGKEPSFLLIELPEYKIPDWKNLFITVRDKVVSFVREAGKIIIVISMVLWLISSFGPGNSLELAEKEAITQAQRENLSEKETNNLIASKKIEESFAGHLGKFIEPVIRPLGFDWKIGIALITSFAAREVFVGTMSTIYSIGSGDNTNTLREKMGKEVDQKTGKKVFNYATSFSLLLFYLFAMQCMSTLAVVKRETGSWKWPIIQFIYMSSLAYLSSLLIYQLLSI